MPLFPRLVPHQATSPQMDLATLIALLSDPNASSSSHRDYHHQSPSHTSPANATHHRPGRPVADSRAFTPKFDISENAQAYILEGELPGLVDKRAVDIEFTDAQTLLIKGKIEKKFEQAVTEPLAAPEEPKQIAQEENKEEHKETEEKEKVEEKPAETTPARPRTPPKPAYVEDSPDEDEDYEDARRSTAILTPTSTVASSPKQEKPKKKAPVMKKSSPPQQAQEQPKKPQQQPQVKYWVSERTIGSFQRTFSFPGLIDQDAVTAKLENGILTVTVPKRAKLPSRRIEIL